MPLPDLSRIPEWYHKYIRPVEEPGLQQALQKQTQAFIHFLEEWPAEKRNYSYAEGKWTVKEVIQHVIDSERVFGYRALCFARKDSTSLPGFDENSYAIHAKAGKRNWDDLAEEFKTVRRSTESLFASFDEEQLENSGMANDNPVYVRGIGFIIAGHAHHHLNILKSRYLTSVNP